MLNVVKDQIHTQNSDTVSTNVSQKMVSAFIVKHKLCTNAAVMHASYFQGVSACFCQFEVSISSKTNEQEFVKDDEIFLKLLKPQCSFKARDFVSLQGCLFIWVSVHRRKDSSGESKETAYCNSTSTHVDLRVPAGVCLVPAGVCLVPAGVCVVPAGVCVVPAGVCGASGGVAQEVCAAAAAAAATFDPELRAAGSVEAVVVVGGDGVT